jgi:hypothetical protein
VVGLHRQVAQKVVIQIHKGGEETAWSGPINWNNEQEKWGEGEEGALINLALVRWGLTDPKDFKLTITF